MKQKENTRVQNMAADVNRNLLVVSQYYAPQDVIIIQNINMYLPIMQDALVFFVLILRHQVHALHVQRIKHAHHSQRC